MTGNKGRFLAYGPLDKRTRRWHYLPGEVQAAGVRPAGDDLIYRSNETTLEIGQGASGYKGLVWLIGLAMGAGLLFISFTLIRILIGSSDALQFLEFGVYIALLAVASVFLLSLVLNDLVGFVDAPLRFDRLRRKVYVWTARDAGPMVLDWDSLRFVVQTASGSPYQANRFHSVLLVDEDNAGKVRFEGKIPRVAQVGAALVDRSAVIAAHEYCRLFMEKGPQSLPPVKRHLVYRPRGWRCFFDILNIIGGFMREYPSLPRDQRSPGWMIFGVVLVAIFAFVLWPWQMTQGVALKFTTRVPKWPAAYEELAAPGGPMLPPSGAEPSDLPMLPHEKLIAAIWVLSALASWTLIARWLG